MGLYIRKGFNAGPFRLNLSRSGLGASFGVKGARIGTGPAGRYVHVGRGGLYYRKSLPAPTQQQDQADSTNNTFQTETVDTMEEIESSDISQMTDESASDLLNELNRVQSRMDLFPTSLVVFILLFIISLGPLSVLLLLVGIPALLYFRHIDVSKGTVLIEYDIESDVSKTFNLLSESTVKLGESGGQWNVEAQGEITDWKTSAGANVQIRRKSIKIELGLPKKVVSNIKVPVLPAGKQTLYFFPERLLVYEGKKVGAISYSDLSIEPTQSKFVEEEKVPHDAEIIDKTWKYVNKKGGPDRRFKDNQELPITLYGQLHLTSMSGLNEMFMFSVPNKVDNFLDGLHKQAALLN